MYIVLTIALSLGTISFHELGHAWALRKCGVPIREISLLGFPVPFLPRLEFRWKSKNQWRPIRLFVHPFLIGAYVRPERQSMERLAPRDTAFVAGAGPFASILYSLVVFGILGLTAGDHNRMIMGAEYLGAAVLLLAFPKEACRYAVLAVGIALTVWIAISAWMDPTGFVSGMGGPATISRQASKIYGYNQAVHNELRGALYVSAWISWVIGTTNMLPISFLDGGRIATAYLGAWNKKVANSFVWISTVAFLALLFMAITNDAHVIGKLF